MGIAADAGAPVPDAESPGVPLHAAIAEARLRLIDFALSHSLDELLQETLDEAELLSGSKIAFYHCVDRDQRSLTLQSWSTRTKAEYCRAQPTSEHYPVESAGVWGECVRARAPVIHNDYESMPNRKSLPAGHAVLVRELVVPVMREGEVRAVVGVGNKPTCYDQTDLEAVSLLADLGWDIADRKMAQDELLASYERFRTVAEHTHDWETWCAPDGTPLYVSPSCERISGHSAAEFMADPGLLTRITHADDLPRLVEHLRMGAAEGRGDALELEFRIVTPDGDVRWIGHVCAPVYGEDGEWLGRRGSNRDTTERMLTEERLAHERRLLQQVEAVAHIGSWRIGPSEHELSDEAARILGFDCTPPDCDVVEAVLDVIHPDDRMLFAPARIRTILAEGLPPIDFRIIRPDGDVRWITAEGEVEVDEGGQSVAVNGVLQDVTARKISEEGRVARYEQDANTDGLTGLLNLRGFELVAEQAVAQAMRAGQGVGLIFCDIDNLKSTNDDLGHGQGDMLLKDVATVLESTLRSADAIARVGGDEFIVLAVGEGPEGVEYLRERLQSGFEHFNSSEERPYRLSVSSGAASRPPGATCRVDELRAAADAQMYEEKLRRHNAAD